eukprot:Opistho-1_new@98502
MGRSRPARANLRLHGGALHAQLLRLALAQRARRIAQPDLALDDAAGPRRDPDARGAPLRAFRGSRLLRRARLSHLAIADLAAPPRLGHPSGRQLARGRRAAHRLVGDGRRARDRDAAARYASGGLAVAAAAHRDRRALLRDRAARHLGRVARPFPVPVQTLQKEPDMTKKTADQLVGELAQRFTRTLDAVIPPGPLALVDFPDHSNVGDSAIWLGEMAYLRKSGRLPAYYSAIADFDDAACRAAIGDGPILIHGGDNMGTLWPKHE